MTFVYKHVTGFRKHIPRFFLQTIRLRRQIVDINRRQYEINKQNSNNEKQWLALSSHSKKNPRFDSSWGLCGVCFAFALFVWIFSGYSGSPPLSTDIWGQGLSINHSKLPIGVNGSICGCFSLFQPFDELVIRPRYTLPSPIVSQGRLQHPF